MSEHRREAGRGAVSVIVPTHDRPDSLVRLLRALASPAGTSPDEVIVVADGCTAETAGAVGALTLPYRVRLIEHQPARGPAIARNAGASEASGDVFLFIDDDIEPYGDVVGEHLRRHDGSPRVVVGAPRMPRQRNAGFHELAGWAWWEQQFERMRASGYRFSYEDVFTGVLSMPRALWRSIGGFDTSLRCREDFELGLRLVRSRVEFVFSDSGGGWHHENRSGNSLVGRKRDEGAADVAMARLHPWAFPALRLARGIADPRADFVRRIAFEWPRVGELGARLAGRLLGVLEWLRMRGTWRRVHGGIMYFSYWRGAAAALGRWDALGALRDAGQRVRPPDYRELDIDLASDLQSVHHRVDCERPDVVHLRCGPLPIGEIRASPGHEPLRGSHVDSLPDELARAMIVARVLAEARSDVSDSRVTGRG